MGREDALNAILDGLLVVTILLFAVVGVLYWKLHGISADMHLHRLAPDVYVYRGFFSNSAVLVLPKSVVIIDNQTTARVGARLAAEVAAITDKPVLHVINTHKADLVFGGARRTRPIVDATEYVCAAKVAAERALALEPKHPIAALNKGMVDVWGALVTGQDTAAAIERLEDALRANALTLPQRLRGAFFLAKAHQSEGREAEVDWWFRVLLPGPLAWFAPVLVPRMRTFP